jgi:hypothetical protein
MTQRLHLVHGGERADPAESAARDVTATRIEGLSPGHAGAHAAWQAAAQRSVDGAQMRGLIAHQHRLTEAGVTAAAAGRDGGTA